MTTTPQDRARLISDTVYDMAARQIQEALQADPTMAQLRAFVSEAVDGFYIDGEFPTLIPKADLLAKPIGEWFKIVADKRRVLEVKLPAPASEEDAGD